MTENIPAAPGHEPTPIMKYFEYSHLPPKLARFSKPFCVLAKQIDVTMKRSAEKTVCLRKLLEAKDACVRASLDEAALPGE